MVGLCKCLNGVWNQIPPIQKAYAQPSIPRMENGGLNLVQKSKSLLIYIKISIFFKIPSILYFVFLSTRYPFLCKHSDAQPPTPSPNGECPTSDFIDLDPNLDSCYFFKMDGANIWNDAHMNCISMGHGSNFASIHSKNEIDKISAELQVCTMYIYLINFEYLSVY